MELTWGNARQVTGPREEPITIMFHSTNSQWLSAIYLHQCNSQPSVEKLPETHNWSRFI